jgi:hypothetical protein
VVACLALLIPQPAFTQWIDYKTPGLPRTADGHVDLTAPRPMSADGRPDLTGLWRFEAKVNIQAALDEAGPQPWIVDAARQYVHELGRNDTLVHCLPSGPRALHSADYAKFIQTPAVTTVLYEGLEYRQIFTDGRPLPTDLNPTWLGYSVGRWEGDTLVVTTAGYNDRTFLTGFGHRHSDALRVSERFRRRDVGHMDVEITFEDPKAYAKPIRIAVEARLQPDTELIEYVCAENERSRPHLIGTADDDRKQQIAVPPAVLARYAGTYRFPPFVPGDTKAIEVTVVAKDGVLALSSDLLPTLTAVPISETRFIAQGIGIHFTVQGSGPATEMIITIVEGEFTGPRVK